MTSTIEAPTNRSSATRVGISVALVSAASFALSGPLSKSLLDAGWTPAAVVATRIGGAFALLAVPTLIVALRSGFPTLRQLRRLVGYGVVATAGAQLCFASAVQYLSVGVALLLEYLAPVALIFWHWWRSKTAPAKPVLIGAAVAMLGMVFVLDLFNGLKLHPIGVAWGLAAMLCLCGYFVLADEASPEVMTSPLVMTTVGTGVGALVLVGVGTVGIVPMAATTADTRLAGQVLPWWVPILLIIGVAAVLAYLTGITAVRKLGSGLASFIGLTEVIFAVVFAAILVGQQPTIGQLGGGALVLTGIALIQRWSRRPDPVPAG